MIPKFRAWHKELKQMMKVYRMDWGFEPPGITLTDVYEKNRSRQINIYGLENIELMQWTGLQDPFGKDIYENDIVESDCDEGTMYEKVVRLSSGLYMLECIFSGEQQTDLESCIESIEVAGNIYENPDLLNAL